MNEAALLKVLDMGLTALEAGIERQAVLAKVEVMVKAGAGPDEIAAALRTMRDDAIAAADRAAS